MLWEIKKIRSDFWAILGIFFSWKLITFLALFFSSRYLTIFSTDKFLGGTYKNFSLLPEFFSWANFDGEHFISIAVNGYKPLQYAFFPLYPKVIGYLSQPLIVNDFTSYFYPIFIGVLVNNLFFLLSLIVLYDLIRIDHSRKIAFLAVLSLVLYPTSFFFGAVYSESLFLFLTLVSFYLARKNKWLYSSIFGLFASVTRIFGILIFFSFVPKFFGKNRFKFFWIFIIPLGLIVYMINLIIVAQDPFAFYNQQLIVGEQHQQGIVTIPQIIFRYIRILLNINQWNMIYQTIILEFISALLFIFLIIFGFVKKINYQYMIYLVLGFIVPTFQGSFSSLPRYVLVLFPGFIFLGIILAKLPIFFRFLYIIVSGVLLFIESSLFFRGYWVS